MWKISDSLYSFRRTLGIGLLIGWSLTSVQAQQEVELAKEYTKAGEYAKAKTLYQKLAKDKEKSREIYKPYLQTLRKLKDWDEAEKFLKKQSKWNNGAANIEADLGRVYEEQEKTEEAKKQYQKAIENAKADEVMSKVLGYGFADNAQIAWAVETFKTAREAQKKPTLFAVDLAKLYRLDGKLNELIEEYLNWGFAERNQEGLYVLLQENLRDEKEFAQLEKQLFAKVQKFPDEPFFNEVLIWHLLQQKDFYKAFLQTKAMDKRYRYEGLKVMDLAFLAFQNKDYPNAGKAFEYLVKEYPRSINYPLWRRMLISAKEEVIKNTFPIVESDIRLLIQEYSKLFAEIGLNQKTLEGLRSTALLYGFYLDQKDTAITVLEKAVALGRQDPLFVDRCKLDMGDIQLLKGDSWEATLLYSQVEKNQKDSPLGYDAKLRNAKLNYYRGDFELAKEVLNILKIATTREIANDALDLALLIQDNTGLDSTEQAMREYASIDLLLFQHQYPQALEKLEQMLVKFKGHPIEDEVCYLRGMTFLKLNEPEKALIDFEKIAKDYQFDILGDDALFQAAKIYEEQKKENNKAMKLYQQLLVKYPGSILGAEARRRFRALRGDSFN
jgi:tetratricopeptide (TPR) repeat protein